MQAHERLAHRGAQLGTEGVRRSRPVGRAADGAQLLEDHAAGRGDEGTRALDERLASEILTGQPLLGELLLDDVLRRDAGVVRAGHPERLASLHASPPHEHVLHGVVQPVPDVEDRRDVRRGHDERVRITFVAVGRSRVVATAAADARGVGREAAGLKPAVVDRGLGRRRIVLRGKQPRRGGGLGRLGNGHDPRKLTRGSCRLKAVQGRRDAPTALTLRGSDRPRDRPWALRSARWENRPHGRP